MRRSLLRSARNTPQRYSSIATWSKCAQPSRPTATAVRKYTSSVGTAGPIVFHQLRKLGCQLSSARCNRRSPAMSTLFGIFSE